jgi:hypothetical protein
VKGSCRVDRPVIRRHDPKRVRHPHKHQANCTPRPPLTWRCPAQPRAGRRGDHRPRRHHGSIPREQPRCAAELRVLTSRKWSGKTLADHRADRKAWLIETLGLEPPDPARYTWEQVAPSDPDSLPPDRRLLHVVADRAQWQATLTEAKRRAQDQGGNLSATGRAA